MAIECSCDYDAPEIYWSRKVRAKKKYDCYECRGTIKAGDVHESVFAKQDGYVYAPRTCRHCVEIREFVTINIPCFCWAHGNMLDDAREIVKEAYSQAADEVRGLAFGFGRLLVKAKREVA